MSSNSKSRNPNAGNQAWSTAGAIPIRNAKGEMTMQKVKVSRYVSGKRPDYAVQSSSEDDSEEEFIRRPRNAERPDSEDERGRASKSPARSPSPDLTEMAMQDRRLRRLMARHDDEDRLERHRHIHEPEVVDEKERQSDSEDEGYPEQNVIDRERERRRLEDDERSDEEDEDEEEVERRREILRQKRAQVKQEEELLTREEEGQFEEEEEESSSYEEYTDSEEDTGPRLKPVFVRKRDRVTVNDQEKELEKEKQAELAAQRLAEERRKETLKLVELEIRREKAEKEEKTLQAGIASIVTDDEDEEAAYESWKLRELRRVKRDREEKEALEKEREEIERWRNMTDEERRSELQKNPKLVTNQAAKGKYKFLQKYYHRGAFFMDKEEDLLRRDYTAATLEDQFDKTILPKVMQVKNFGRSGRTKYTHLVDQDTSVHDSPWYAETAANAKFYSQQAAGVRPVFERPALSKDKKNKS
nr:EOG090X08WT [Triops cancriformis]